MQSAVRGLGGVGGASLFHLASQQDIGSANCAVHAHAMSIGGLVLGGRGGATRLCASTCVVSSLNE
jgi:hypothetical protein